MNNMTDRTKFVAKPWIKFAVCDVIVEPATFPQMSDAEERVYRAFFDYKEVKGKYPNTAQVAKSLGVSNQTWVHDLLMRLVGGGYIACYLKASKRQWTDRDNGLRMQKALNQ